MKTQSQHIADMIARGEEIDSEEDFNLTIEVIESVVMLLLFVFAMGMIMYLGLAAGY